MENTPTTTSGNGHEGHISQPLGSAGRAARLQPVPTAPADSEPAVGGAPVQRAFTFTTVTGENVTVACMPGCTVDHRADSNTPTHPHDIYCSIPGTADELPLYGPLCNTRGPEDFRFLNWQIESYPFSARPAERLPFVAIEVFDDHYIEYLEPDTLQVIIGRLQKRVDSLREAHAQLVNVRTEYVNLPGVAA
ncbi:DUF6907 domain-containing protein [Streptomyces sp. NBC_01723]|uniref:DUF6907 domain-containing protein n=1 Tax=Streptomyces sp. NBC_01723 TaxID=2975921 RepID=UPI003FCD3D88